MSEEVKVRDFEIPVPWGVMAGQEWLGGEGGHPWIALHGWMDNCGSLDGVARLLAEAGHRVISLDLPGHGFSSHYPPGRRRVEFAEYDCPTAQASRVVYM